MKYALVIPDGVADEPQDALGGLTPLQAAATPHMDAVATAGVMGQADHVPADMPSGSDVGTMSLFGYDPHVYHTGRAPLEAAAQGIELAETDWAVRCNLVTVLDGVMRSFTAGQIPNGLATELINLLDAEVADDPAWKFHVGVSYRNLLLHHPGNAAPIFGPETETVPPHDITDQTVDEFLPQGSGSEVLRKIMSRSEELFAQCSANSLRQQRGELPATGVWLWGLGKRPALTPFIERFGVTGAVITAVDLLRGIGKLLGWRIIEVPGATGFTDTDYAAKGRYAMDALADVDFIVVHVEATDEASHEGDAIAKVQALEAIDREIVGPLHAFLKGQGDYRLLVSPDHPTFLRTKTHSHGYVPIAMCGTGIQPDEVRTYDEVAAAAATLTFDKGCDLMPQFLSDSPA